MIAIAGGARVVALTTILIFAAATGLAVGDLLNAERASSTNAGYPDGWQGGAAVPVSRTATASFSIEALEAVQATRGDRPAESDYALRHRPATPNPAPSTHRAPGAPQPE